MTPLVLASTSVYRRELLTRLGLPFTAQKPTFDEEAAQQEQRETPTTPQQIQEWCQHLSREKARSLSQQENCVIGGDQMVVLNGKILGKPGTPEKAHAQLTQMQGRSHQLLTAVSVFHGGSETSFMDVATLHMRILTASEIANYVQWDQALDCAGSYKIEKHGISLFDKIESQDFTAIQGLPLLRLSQLLRQLGYSVPGPASGGK